MKAWRRCKYLPINGATKRCDHRFGGDLINSPGLPHVLDPGKFGVVSTIALKVLELVKSLPLAEQQMIRAELAKGTANPRREPRRQLQRLPDGSYYNPEGIPNDDPIFKVLEEVEEDRHRTPGPPAPKFD